MNETKVNVDQAISYFEKNPEVFKKILHEYSELNEVLKNKEVCNAVKMDETPKIKELGENILKAIGHCFMGKTSIADACDAFVDIAYDWAGRNEAVTGFRA